MSSILVANHNVSQMNGALLEKVILGNDLSGLNSLEKVQYIKSVCDTLGLNPVTQPIKLLKLSGKETPYVTKDATEQLRKINKVSISNIETKMLDGGVYVVTAYATTPDGRQDSSTGVISVTGLKGDAMANAMMKAETKAKRRATLSICGLGFMDESEIDSIPNAQKVDLAPEPKVVLQDPIINEEPIEDHCIDQDVLDISWSKDIQELREIYGKAYKFWMKNKHKENLQKCVKAKDKKLTDLESGKTIIDAETGEIQ